MPTETQLCSSTLRRLYKLMSAPMIDFDCGNICSKNNEGIPFCCDSESVVPIIFRDEYKFHKKTSGDFWKKRKMKTREEREMVDECSDNYVFVECPGPAECRRGHRALVCRTFPFEPYLDRKGTVLGLVFQRGHTKGCHLIGMPLTTFNPKYMRQAMIFWQELLDLIPEEKELYMDESRKRDRNAKRKGEIVKYF